MTHHISNEQAILSLLQEEIGEWSYRNFGNELDFSPEMSTLGLVEEVGELCRTLVKRQQGIRGTWEEWTGKFCEELGDVMIKLFDVAERERQDLGACFLRRWVEVKQRDWVNDKMGHGQPTED